MNKEKEGYFKLLIYYRGENHPMIVERDTQENTLKWLHSKHNRRHFKECSSWNIQDNKGNELASGNTEVISETKIVVNPHSFIGCMSYHKHVHLMNRMTEYAASSHGTSTAEVKGTTRKQDPKTARFICMYMLYKCTDLTYSAIGQYYGGKDHSTVLHAVKVIEQEMELTGLFSKQLKAYISELKKYFKLNVIITK